MSAQKMALDDLKVDVTSLYREETISDYKMATFRRLVPIKEDGTDDASRPVIYTASTSIYTQMGVIPLNAELEAKDLKAAIAEFPGAIKKAMEKLMEDAREMQRQEASRIVVPDSQTASKIQLA